MRRTRYASRFRSLPSASHVGVEPTFRLPVGDGGGTPGKPRALGRVVVDIDPTVMTEFRTSRKELLARVDTLSTQLEESVKVGTIGMTALAALLFLVWVRRGRGE